MIEVDESLKMFVNTTFVHSSVCSEVSTRMHWLSMFPCMMAFRKFFRKSKELVSECL